MCQNVPTHVTISIKNAKVEMTHSEPCQNLKFVGQFWGTRAYCKKPFQQNDVGGGFFSYHLREEDCIPARADEKPNTGEIGMARLSRSA